MIYDTRYMSLPLFHFFDWNGTEKRHGHMAITQLSYSDEAYLAIRAKIIRDEVPFGARLHIGNLAEELGVSPTPVREALNRLAANGLAEMTPHKGIFVIDPCQRDVKELCQARLCLESQMAEAVIQNGTPQDIEKLRWYADDMLDTMRVLGFHGYYAQTSGNRVLIRLHTQVHSTIGVLFSRATTRPKPTYLAQHQKEEEQIIQAIEDGEVARLRAAIKLHIENLEEFLLSAKVAKVDAPSSSPIERSSTAGIARA
jgi:DNA-binding GntR family transcriptional regulator